jgi:hypothetical protein
MSESLTLTEQVAEITRLSREAVMNPHNLMDYDARISAYPRYLIVSAAGEEKGGFSAQFEIWAYDRAKLQQFVDSAAYLFTLLSPDEQDKAEMVADYISDRNLSLRS